MTVLRRAAVDLGTSTTCVAVDGHGPGPDGTGGEPRVVLVDGSPLMSSAVHADGRSIFVGAEAERQAAVDPARFEPHPKRRIDEGSLLLGDTVVGVQQALRAVLVRAVGEARAVLGGAPLDQLVLTHPADWSAVRVSVLTGAAAGLAAAVVCVPEPVAAAVQHAARSGPGARLAVLDVGAGTTDVSVLERTATGFRVLATAGDGGFGGVDVDQVLLEHVGRGVPAQQRPEWESVVGGRSLEQRRRRRALGHDVRSAKETLSRHAYADLPLPGGLADAHVTRDDLERLVAPRVAAVVELLAGALARTGGLDVDGRSTVPVFLVGGSSRLPLVARLVHQRLGVLPVSVDQPETVVARGALLAVPVPAVPAAPAAPEGPYGGSAPPAPSSGVAVPRRWGRAVAAVVAVAVLAVGATLAVRARSAPDGAAAGAEVSRTVVAQHASIEVPRAWQEAERSQAGSTSRLVLTPDGDPASPQRLLLVQTRLAAAQDLGDVAGTLGAQLQEQQVTGRRYDGFDPAAAYAGREVVRYREQPDAGGVVDWFVLVDDGYQLSVGCQHPADGSVDGGGRPGSGAARCERAVASVAGTGG